MIDSTTVFVYWIVKFVYLSSRGCWASLLLKGEKEVLSIDFPQLQAYKENLELVS